jgi:hypothetical protein
MITKITVYRNIGFWIIIFFIIIFCPFSYAYAEEVSNKQEKYDKLYIGIGLGIGVQKITDDMYHFVKEEENRINEINRKNGTHEFSTDKNYSGGFWNLFVDYFPVRWLNLYGYSEYLISDNSSFGDDDNETFLPRKYDMDRFSIGFLPGYSLAFNKVSLITNVGMTYNRVTFMDYNVKGFGYRGKLSLVLIDKSRCLLIQGMKIFILYDQFYSYNNGVKIGSWGIQFGVEPIIFQ